MASNASNLRRTLSIGIGIIVALALIIGIRLVTSGGDSNDSDSNLAADPDGRSCTHLTLMASSEKGALLSQIAETYNASARADDLEGNCARVDVTTKASGAALSALSQVKWDEANGPIPDVWSPASTSWLRLLSVERSAVDAPSISPEDAPSIANTPLVIAMPRPMAESLGWPDAPLGWSDVLDLGTDLNGWGSAGHPEWGAFKLGKTNPNFSTSGLHATVGAYYAATGLSSDLTSERLRDPATIEYVSGVEASVVHYGDTTLTFLTNMRKAAEEGRALSYISAAAVEEKSVWDYNQGNPTGDPATLGDQAPPEVPLVAIYPKEGTLYSDNPFITLTGPWVTPEKKIVADDFYQFLTLPPQQEMFMAAGFRSFEGTPGSTLTLQDGFIPQQPSVVISSPPPTVLSEIKDNWDLQRKRARVLLVVDVSGSMGEATASGSSKLSLAKEAALIALEDFSPQDEVGLWIFSSDRDLANERPYIELVPIDSVENNLEDLQGMISNLTPDGGTALYATARASIESMNANLDPTRINAVVLLTDGRNEYPQDTDLPGLVSDLKGASENNGVRLFTIGYGKDADLPTLEMMSEASQAAAYDASDPSTINSVFTAVISNF